MIGRAFPRRLVVLDAAISDDHAAGDEHARAFHQAELYGVAHADVGEPGAARHRNAGDAGTQHLLGAAGGFQRREFRPRRALAFAFALDQRIAVGHVAMGIDQAGHDPFPGGVYHVDGLAVFEVDVSRQRADALDAVAFDDDGVVARRRFAGAVDQRAVADDECLLGGAHGSSGEIASFRRLYSGEVGSGIAACGCALPLPAGERESASASVDSRTASAYAVRPCAATISPTCSLRSIWARTTAPMSRCSSAALRSALGLVWALR